MLAKSYSSVKLFNDFMIMNIFLNKTNKGCEIVILKNRAFKQNINEKS